MHPLLVVSGRTIAEMVPSRVPILRAPVNHPRTRSIRLGEAVHEGRSRRLADPASFGPETPPFHAGTRAADGRAPHRGLVHERFRPGAGRLHAGREPSEGIAPHRATGDRGRDV